MPLIHLVKSGGHTCRRAVLSRHTAQAFNPSRVTCARCLILAAGDLADQVRRALEDENERAVREAALRLELVADQLAALVLSW